jgi:hypothetical protein
MYSNVEERAWHLELGFSDFNEYKYSIYSYFYESHAKASNALIVHQFMMPRDTLHSHIKSKGNAACSTLLMRREASTSVDLIARKNPNPAKKSKKF